MKYADYQIYIDRLSDLRNQEEAQLQVISCLKKERRLLFRRKKKQTQEEAEEQLHSIRAEAEALCEMLDQYREKEGEKVMQQAQQFFDEKSQEYNEVIGVCYGKAILVTDSGQLLWFECPEGAAAIGDCEWDDGLLAPFSALPVGERRIILSYLIEAGSTPIHYLNFLKEEYKK